MENNNADIELLASLDINSSEPEILRAIQILQKRIRNNDKAKVKLETDIDRTTFNTDIDKLQKIIRSKDLTIDTRKSIEALLNESNAMIDMVQSARKAANEKIEFANANEKVKESADNTANAIRRERNAMESLDDIDYIMNNITRSGQQGNSVFQQFGTTLRDAFYAFTAANILQDAIYKVIDAGRESVEVVKELNDAATSLRMATGDGYESVKRLLSSYNEMGQELGAITTDVSESADEWLRQGHSIEDTNTLIKDSMILSKVSNLDSAESTKYLTSAMQGYKVAVENVLGIVDKLSAVDLESATDAGGLAEAMSRTAEGANLADISMDRLLGMIATVGEVTQKSMSSIGESYKTIFSRMRDIKDNKLSVVGEDGEIEDLSNVEIVLDSLGIKLRESNQEFRNFQEVLDEVAGNWDNYSSVQQAAIAKAFSGVRQQENFLVMMENWDKVLEYTDVASNSSGTSEEKFGFYLESLEAKTNSLQASLENLASTTISDELYGSVLDTSKAVVDLIADTGALKGLFVGLGTAGGIYVFQQLAHYLGDATQGFSNLSEAMSMIRNGTVGINDMQRLVDLTSGLSQSQTMLLLSTDNLTDAQKVAILMGQGMEQNLAEQQIQTWGVATAQNGATSATVTFTGALRGLWATLMANPLVLVTTLVSTAAIVFNKFKEAQEEARQKSQELTQAWQEENDTIDETISKYKDLKENIENGTLSTEEITSAKEELASIEDTLVEKYGTEALNIDLVNGKYEEQLATLKELSKEKAKQYVAENGKSIKNDIEYLEDDFYSSVNLALGKAGAKSKDAIGFDLDTILKNYPNLSVGSHLNGATRTFRLDANGTREQTYNQLVKLYSELKEKYGSENKNVNSVLDKITSLLESYYDKDEIDAAKDRVKSYAEADILSQNNTRALYDEATDAVEQYNEVLASGKGVDEAKANLEIVQGKVNEAFGENGILSDIHGAEDVFNGLWNNVSSGATQAEDDVKKTFSSIYNSLSDSRTSMISVINNMSEGFEELDKIYASIQDKDPFDFKLLDNKNFKETFSGLEGYADFIEQITSNSNDINACQSAFNNLVTEWIYSTGILDNVTDENAQLTASMLKQMGVVNAEKLVTNSLAATHEYATWAKDNEKASTEDLSKATWEELEAFYAESSASDEAKNHIVAYYLQKQLATGLTLDTSGDAKNLLTLVKALGGATTALQTYYKAKTNAEKYAKLASKTDDDYSKKVYEDEVERQNSIAKNTLSEIQKDVENTVANVSLNSTVNYNGGNKSNYSSSSAKETKETFDWIETILSRIQRSISNLGKTVSATWKSWTERNNALISQISNVNRELDLQYQARTRYEQQANSVGLDENTKRLVRDGAIDITTVDDNTAELIKEYQKWYEKILECDDAIIDLKDDLADLAQTKFDNAAKQFEDPIAFVDHENAMLEATDDLLETRGYLASKSVYNSLIQNTQNKKGILQSQRNTLMDNLNNSGIEKGTEAWNKMYLKILDLDEEILKLDNDTAEYQNTLRELDWEVFDIIQEKISGITDEAEFLINLMSNNKMFNDDGSATNQGQATLGLHAMKYNTYMEQADDYAKEMQKIDAELANDPNNQKLQERKEELLELWRESVLAADDEKQSIKDLVSDGYDTLLDSMSKIIDKRKDMLSQVKDLYDYEKSIAEQTAEVSKYQKIINSMQGMADTEEGQAMLQKYEVSLKEAKENLEETEYDKYISDQEKILDNLYDEVEEWLNQRLDDLDTIIDEVIKSTNNDAANIETTLKEQVGGVGGTLTKEMESIWRTGDNSVLSNYKDFGDKITTVNTTLDEIRKLVSKMAGESDNVANETISNSTPTTTTSSPAPAPSNPVPTPVQKTISVGGMINAGNATIYRDSSGGGASTQYFKNDPIYTVVGEKNGFVLARHHSKSSGNTGWFRKSDVKAYKTGGLVDETGLAWLDGAKGKPEMVLNAKDTENFIELKDVLSKVSQSNMFDAINGYARLPSFVPNMSNQNVTSYNGNVYVELPNVTNAQEFADQFKEIYDKNIGKTRTMLQTDMFSKNSLEYRRYL